MYIWQIVGGLLDHLDVGVAQLDGLCDYIPVNPFIAAGRGEAAFIVEIGEVIGIEDVFIFISEHVAEPDAFELVGQEGVLRL